LSRKAADVFTERGVPNARLDAELLLAHVLQIDRLKLYLQHDRPVTPPELEKFREFVRRRIKREPVQLIIGSVTFRDLKLTVDRRALIPRPETEVLVGEVLKWATSSESPIPEPRGLDIGTGTGAIALCLAKEGGFRMLATDVSADALALAAENTTRLGLLDLVDLAQGATWDAVPAGAVFDVVVSNPPYIGEGERGSLEPEVVAYEPAAALFAQDSGLAVLCAIIDGAHSYLRPGGLLAMEMGSTQGGALVERIEATGEYGTPRVVRDYAGRDRIVMVEKRL
jgi:release factor glutamine methyltransferase